MYLRLPRLSYQYSVWVSFFMHATYSAHLILDLMTLVRLSKENKLLQLAIMQFPPPPPFSLCIKTIFYCFKIHQDSRIYVQVSEMVCLLRFCGKYIA